MVFFARPPRWTALCQAARVVVATGCLVAAMVGPADALARERSTDPGATHLVGGSVALADLPTQAQQTYRRVFAGGPFSSRKDGSVFGNFERALPRQPRGYYHEYTVPTPGARTRGARRIVCGGNPPTRPAACFYTGDHYASFRQIAP